MAELMIRHLYELHTIMLDIRFTFEKRRTEACIRFDKDRKRCFLISLYKI